MIKIVNKNTNRLKYFSICGRILSPYSLIIPAINIKRAPREINEQAINGWSGSWQKPADIVITLYGNGVKPAINTAQCS